MREGSRGSDRCEGSRMGAGCWVSWWCARTVVVAALLGVARAEVEGDPLAVGAVRVDELALIVDGTVVDGDAVERDRGSAHLALVVGGGGGDDRVRRDVDDLLLDERLGVGALLADVATHADALAGAAKARWGAMR